MDTARKLLPRICNTHYLDSVVEHKCWCMKTNTFKVSQYNAKIFSASK